MYILLVVSFEISFKYLIFFVLFFLLEEKKPVWKMWLFVELFVTNSGLSVYVIECPRELNVTPQSAGQ